MGRREAAGRGSLRIESRVVEGAFRLVSEPTTVTRRTRRRVLATGAILTASLVAGCLDALNGSIDGESEEDGATPPSADGGADETADSPSWRPAEGSPRGADIETRSAVTDLDVPWDLAFAGEDALITERPGGVLRFDRETLTGASATTPADAETVLAGTDLPDRADSGEGGTLGVATHPDYPDPPALYVYYTADGDLTNRVVRYDRETGDVETVVDGIPGAAVHNGGRIAFGPDGALWILTGDAEEPSLTQEPGSLAGATLRVTPEGDPAPDNPDFEGGDSLTYTLGHRNLQGVAFTPDGTPVVSEHGPQDRDEVSLLDPGANYGWDTARGGPGDPDYDSYDDHSAFAPPVINTGPETTWAPSGIAFYTDDAISAWENRLFVAGLRSETLFAVSLLADGVEGPSADELADEAVRYDADWLDDRFDAVAYPLFEGEFGRLRHAAQGPDGSLYLLTSNRDGRAGGSFPSDGDDRVVRVDPA